MTTDKKRIQVEMTPESFKRLEKLRTSADIVSNTEVVRKALRLYEWFDTKQKEGFHVSLARGEEVREVNLLF